jgi:hypothetical protein
VPYLSCGVQAHRLGGGGFGEVYKGWYLYTYVAIKILCPGCRHAMRGFVREVQHLWNFRHKNIIDVSLAG